MKIRLIEPKPAGINVFDLAKLPRLGLPLLAALLGERGHDVRVYVEVLAPVDWKDIAGSDLVGVSTTSSTASAAYRLAQGCRRLGIATVAGGSHVTFRPDEALEHCDYVARGEGHETMLELVAALERGGPLDAISGLSYLSVAGAPVHNEARPNCSDADLARLPAPAISAIVGSERMTTIPVMTQWGCPFDCDFCSVIAMFGRRVRSREIATVLDELETYRNRGGIFFYDDNFIVDKRRTSDLLRGMIGRGLTQPWSAQVRAETVYKDKRTRAIDRELLGLMRDSGCRVVFCGFESADGAALAAYNKKQDVETIRDAVRAFHEFGIGVHGMFVLGSDTDDKGIFDRTVDFALANAIDTVQFMILTPFPGTALCARLEAEGRVLTHDWSRYDGHHCVIAPARMTPYELQMGTYRAMARFYSARRSWRMLWGSAGRNLPSLVPLLAREWRLHFRLPRALLLGLSAEGRTRIGEVLRSALSEPARRRLESIFWVPAARFYARSQIKRWLRQARSRAYLEELRGAARWAGRGGA